MANVITKQLPTISRDGGIRVVPLGDIHIGAAACDEDHFRQTVKYISDEGLYWVGMGDYCDFINKSDKRFSVDSLADWIGIKELGDLAKNQERRFLEIVKPIASRCLGLVMGNHEATILTKYERDIYSNIVTGIKERGGFKDTDSLALGYSGWLRLQFRRNGSSSRRQVLINCHHGFVGGKLAGAKALNMQRWLWNHEADLVIFGHSHNTSVQREAVEYIDDRDNIAIRDKIGCYSGTFLKTTQEGTTTYSEVKGYFPLPTGGVEAILTPFKRPKVKVMT